MPFLREIVLASVFAVAFAWHLIHASRKSSRLAAALAVISSGFAGYMLLNVYQVEIWLADATELTALSSLLKNLVFAWVAFGCVATWKVFNVAAKFRLVAGAVIVAYVCEAFFAWNVLRTRCAEDEGLSFDKCALGVPVGAWTETLGLLLVASAGLLSAWFIRPILGWSRREERSASLLVAGVLVSVVWAIVAAIGVADIYRTGDLSYFQYLVRTPLAAAAVVLVFSAVLYGPISQLWTFVTFFVQCRPVVVALEVHKNAPVAAGAVSRFGVTGVMDALGNYLNERDISVAGHSYQDDVTEVAYLLLGRRVPSVVAIPSEASGDTQRRWLIAVAKVMQHDLKQAGSPS